MIAPNLPWLFKLPSEMTPPEYGAYLIASMQVGSAIHRWMRICGWAL